METKDTLRGGPRPPAESAGNQYTVTTLANCKIIRGKVPLRDTPVLLQLVPDGHVDTEIASQIGANLVIGTADNLHTLREMNLTPSEDREHDAAKARGAGAPEGVVQWLLRGSRGVSSKAMCHQFYGAPAATLLSHPEDPDDFSRCIEFLNVVPVEDRMKVITNMKSVSPQWAALVEHWEALEADFSKGSANLYQKMKRIINQAA